LGYYWLLLNEVPPSRQLAVEGLLAPNYCG